MKKFIFLLLFFPILSAHAEVFRSKLLGAGRFSLGIEPEITFDGNTDATLFLNGGFGIAGGYGVHFRAGFGESPFNDDSVHLGGMFDIPLIRDGRGYPGLFLSLGISSLGKVSIDNHLILQNDFGPLTVYGGLDDSFTFVDGSGGTDVRFPIELIFGTEVDFSRPMHFLFEVGIDLNDSSSFVSMGLKFYIP